MILDMLLWRAGLGRHHGVEAQRVVGSLSLATEPVGRVEGSQFGGEGPIRRSRPGGRDLLGLAGEPDAAVMVLALATNSQSSRGQVGVDDAHELAKRCRVHGPHIVLRTHGHVAGVDAGSQDRRLLIELAELHEPGHAKGLLGALVAMASAGGRVLSTQGFHNIFNWQAHQLLCGSAQLCVDFLRRRHWCLAFSRRRRARARRLGRPHVCVIGRRGHVVGGCVLLVCVHLGVHHRGRGCGGRRRRCRRSGHVGMLAFVVGESVGQRVVVAHVVHLCQKVRLRFFEQLGRRASPSAFPAPIVASIHGHLH